MDIAPIALLGTAVLAIAHLLDGMSQQNHFFAVNGSCSIMVLQVVLQLFPGYLGLHPHGKSCAMVPWGTLPAAANYHENPAMGLIGRQVGLAI